jgi:[ribosomal protein S5]-alanine N-acetyltransferase
MTNYFLLSNRIGLKKLTLNDVNLEYLSWINDKEVTKFLETGSFPTSLDELKDYVLNISQNINDIFLGVFDIKDNKEKHIGNVKLTNINWIHRTAEFGIMIGDKNYWGKGYGREVTSTMVKYGFEALNLRKIYLGVFGSHNSAIYAYQKAGFEIESIMKEHLFLEGKYDDKVWMSIFNKNFKK